MTTGAANQSETMPTDHRGLQSSKGNLAAVTCSALVILAVHAFIYLFIWNSLMTHLEPHVIEEFSGFNFTLKDTVPAGTVLFPDN